MGGEGNLHLTRRDAELGMMIHDFGIDRDARREHEAIEIAWEVEGGGELAATLVELPDGTEFFDTLLLTLRE